MCLICSAGYAAVSVAVATSTVAVPKSSSVDPAEYSGLRATVKSISVPTIEQPQWLKDQLAAEVAASVAAQNATGAKRAESTINVTYSVTTKGAVTADLAEFKLQANQTLNDARGWSRMNINFSEVANGGTFTLVLAEANQLPTYSSGCSSEYSCNVGRFIIINQDRWLGATPSWNNAGGSMRDYRHMVVNHETGHWLGHSHESCSGAGQPAPVMQQQSIDLQGCTFNPWPLASELNSTRLGI